MDDSQSFWQFIVQHADKLWSQVWAHIGLTMISLLFAVLIAVPVGLVIARRKKLAGPVLGIAGILQTIPSIALLGILIPYLGIGVKPAILVLFLYALLPIIRNTYTGLTTVDPVLRDAAKGMGMSSWQILTKVEIPLAFPVLMAGIRTATVINVGVATLAAYIAAGGLGEFIFGGIALNNANMILAGAIPAAALAIALDFLLSLLQRIKLKTLRIVPLTVVLFFILLPCFSLLPSHGRGSLLAGFTPEFIGREDGYLGLKNKYQMHIENVVISDAVMYTAAYEQKIDVISGYSTDGRLKAFDLQILQDDKGIFPPYYAAPLVRNELLQQYPELLSVLNQLSGTINDEVMTSLNYKVDQLKQSPEQVATDFLQSIQLYKPARSGIKGEVRVGSKIFGEQYILAQLYKILIEGNTDLAVATKTGLGGTKICFDALLNNEIDLYPEYTGTGFLVLLQPDVNTRKVLSGDSEGIYNYVSKEFKDQFNLVWLKPIGFNNSYAVMMRRQQAQSLRIKTISDLTAYINRK